MTGDIAGSLAAPSFVQGVDGGWTAEAPRSGTGHHGIALHLAPGVNVASAEGALWLDGAIGIVLREPTKKAALVNGLSHCD